MPSAHPSITLPESHQEQATVTSLLSHIRNTDIPIDHIDILVTAVRLRARTQLLEVTGMVPNPCNLDVTIPSNHELNRHNGFVYVHPVQGTRGPFYVITHGRLVGVIANWLSAAPYVHGIEGAIFIKIRSMVTAARLLITAIDDDAVEYIA